MASVSSIDLCLGKYGINRTTLPLEAFAPKKLGNAELHQTESAHIYHWDEAHYQEGTDIVKIVEKINILSEQTLREQTLPALLEVVNEENEGLVAVLEKPPRSIREIFKQNAHLLPTATIIELARNILKGLQVLHANDFVHLAINPSQISFKGFRTLHFKHLGKRFSYTLSSNDIELSAPEILFEKECTKKVDLWDLGILLYELYTGNFLIPQDDNPISRLHFVQKVLGELPQGLLKESAYAEINERGRWILKDYKGPPRLLEQTTPLKERIQKAAIAREDHEESEELVCNFLSGILQLNPTKRWSAGAALEFLNKALSITPVAGDDHKESPCFIPPAISENPTSKPYTRTSDSGSFPKNPSSQNRRKKPRRQECIIL